MGRRTAERAALLDYLRGEWAECAHEGVGLPGCPTCEGRWSSDVRRVVQEHRDRVRAEVKAEIDARTDTLDELRHRAWSRVAELERDAALAEAAELRERNQALAEVERPRAGVDLPPGHRVAVVTIAAADDDPTFTVGGMTVRACPCGALVAGGPTRCIACASRLDRGPIASSERTRRAVVHLIESLGREIGDDSVAADFLRAIAVLLEVDLG